MSLARNGRTILLGEDDLEVRKYLETALKCQGYSVELARDGDEVIAHLQRSEAPISAVLLDIIMPRRDGFEALKEIRRFNKDVPVIMISGASSPLNVVEAMRNGANNFVAKPIDPEDLRKALEALELQSRPAPPRVEQSSEPSGGVFFGTTPSMLELQRMIGEIGWSEAPVLIQGETGVGKEVLAREIHARSPRAKKPILKLNCVALPSELVESELFGYERGAFTGAFQKKPGMFEYADGGTVFLDEIGDMDFKLQAKLLQVLQDHEFQRLGGKETVHVDVRVIAATHRNLAQGIADNTFREDLYYRLNVLNIKVPPLRERKEDILAIAEFLIRKHAGTDAPLAQIPPFLQELFKSYEWPGNIRELENVIRRFLVFRSAEMIERDLRANASHHKALCGAPPAVLSGVGGDMPSTLMPVDVDASDSRAAASILDQLRTGKEQAERNAILAALKLKNWNRKHAALLLNIDYKALLYKMKKLSIHKEKTVPQTNEADEEAKARAAGAGGGSSVAA